jgi:hypothetical protein
MMKLRFSFTPVLLQVLLSSACALPLYPELALMHSRAGNHVAALLLLALLPPRLVEGAISYCRRVTAY